MQTNCEKRFDENKKDMKFYDVKDAGLKELLRKLTLCKKDANSFSFWSNGNENENFWGLTIKSQNWDDNEKRYSVVWKLTLYVTPQGEIKPTRGTVDHFVNEVPAENIAKISKIYESICALNNLKK